MTQSLSGNIMSRLALRVWKRLSSLKWWQALLLFWTSVGLVVLLNWIEIVLFVRTPILYQLGLDATWAWIEFYGVLFVLILLVKGLSSFVRELRKSK